LHVHRKLPSILRHGRDDVRELSNYVPAIDHDLTRLKEGFPLSLRLLREIHGMLLAHGRGQRRDPGGFRRSQNWIGGTRPGNAAFVPPPPQEVTRSMGDLERFLHAETPEIRLLVKAGRPPPPAVGHGLE
jgi:cell filamentation protein, protein adenylyltransferase